MNKVTSPLSCAFVTLFLVACTTIPDANDVINPRKSVSTYIAAKRDYVSKIEESYGARGDGAFRLIAVTGPQWSIGTSIDVNNPLNIVSNKCIYRKEDLPDAVAWNALPGFTREKEIDFGAGLPESVVSFLGDSRIRADFNLKQNGNFEIVDMSAVIIPEDDFESSLGAECKEVLNLKGGYLVRGVVYGREIFSSQGGVSVGGNIKVVEDEVLKIQYSDGGEFKLEDKEPQPKMFFMAHYPKKNRTQGDDNQEKLTDSQARELESLMLVVPN